MLKDFLISLSAGGDLPAGFRDRADEINRLLEIYIAEIERFNPAYKLVSYRTREELVTRHIADSLAPLGIIMKRLKNAPGSPPDGRVNAADAGSGAGLPGIPLAIAAESIHWTLIEAKERRAGFLRNCAALLSLRNADIEQRPLENTAPARFDFVTFRALSPLTKPFVKKIHGMLKPSGFFAAWKGKRDTLLKEIEAAGLTNYEIHPYTAGPPDRERCLLIAENT